MSKRIFWRIWASLFIATAILVADYFFTNITFPLFQVSDSFWLFGYASQRKEDPGLSELMCINIGLDKQLAAVTDEFGDTVGHVSITDRDALLKLMKVAEQADYRYLFLDVRFEKGLATDADSALFSTMRTLPRFVFSTHRADGYEIADSSLIEKSAMADYRGNMFTGFTRYEFLQDGAESVALRMYRELTGRTISQCGPVYLSDGALSYNLQFIPLPSNVLFHYGEHGEIRYPYLGSQIFALHSEEELIGMMKDKIVIVGDFDNDLHQSYIGEIPGPLISYYAYRLLLDGGHRVNWLYQLIQFAIYLLIIFWLLWPNNDHDKFLGRFEIKSPLLLFALSIVSWKLILTLLKILFYRLFRLSFITAIPSVVFTIIIYVMHFKGDVLDQTEKEKKKMRKFIYCLVALLLFPFMLFAEGDTVYQIMRLNSPTITIGGKSLKVGDTFKDPSTIKWNDYDQAMEVKNTTTGTLYRFSRQVFESKGAVLSVKDFFLRTNRASSRDTDFSVNLYESPSRQQFPDRRIALVVGNSNYFNLSYLRNAQKDAMDVASVLLSLGFDVLQVYECTYEDMRTALNKFSSLAGNYDVALFYFAGHGLQEDGKNYLIPINATLEYRSELARLLSCEDVVDRMDAAGTPSRLIFLDACRNAKKYWSRDATEGLARMEGSPGSVIVFSTQSGKVALDGDGDNSPFAASLIRNIVKPELSFSDAMIALVRDTYDLTEQRQYPLQVGTLIKDFRFNPLAQEIRTDVQVAFNPVQAPAMSSQSRVSPQTSGPESRVSGSVVPSVSESAAELVAKGLSSVRKFRMTQALDYFQQAAAQGSVEANFYLGELYYNGNGVDKSFPTAKTYFEKAANAGFAEAQYMLGVMYRNGQGCPKNLTTARQWLQRAALQGHAKAEQMLR